MAVTASRCFAGFRHGCSWQDGADTPSDLWSKPCARSRPAGAPLGKTKGKIASVAARWTSHGCAASTGRSMRWCGFPATGDDELGGGRLQRISCVTVGKQPLRVYLLYPGHRQDSRHDFSRAAAVKRKESFACQGYCGGARSLRQRLLGGSSARRAGARSRRPKSLPLLYAPQGDPDERSNGGTAGDKQT